MRIRKSTIALAAIALLAAGCSGDGNAANTTAPTFTTTDATSPTTSATSTTTTSTSTTSTTSTTTTPLTVTTPSTAPGPSIGGPVDSEDWVVTIQSLLDTRDALNAAPDPTRAGEVYFPGLERWQVFENQLTNLQKDGQRTVDVDPTTVLNAERTFYSPDSGDGLENVLVKVQIRLGANFGRIVDANGATVFEIVPETTPPDGIITAQYSLGRSKGGPWLIVAESRL